MSLSAAPNERSEDRPPRCCVIELKPRCALTPRGARHFLYWMGATTFTVASVFAAWGYWPVLLFAVLEMAALNWALRLSMRAGAERETITVSADWVTIDSSRYAGRHAAVFPRHWAKVTLHHPLAALHPSRLTVESHGRTCEIGRFLTEDERRRLAVRLKQLVGNVNESPAL